MPQELCLVFLDRSVQLQACMGMDMDMDDGGKIYLVDLVSSDQVGTHGRHLKRPLAAVFVGHGLADGEPCSLRLPEHRSRRDPAGFRRRRRQPASKR